METREYIVILRDRTDLDDFYTDMEQHSHYEYVPDRSVELSYRRPMSRSTHYLLTPDEAATLAQDPRVMEVQEPYYNRNISIAPLGQYSDKWDKSGTNSQTSRNWALLRGYERATRSNWGSDGTATAAGTINLTNVGNNVDVVIADGHIVPGHPEFAVNDDGTGGSRLNQFNWFQYNSQVRSTTAGTYVYDFLTDASSIANNNHGCNVAGIAAGNTCGWARGANVYNISPYSGSTANATGYGNYIYDLINYIRVFHSNKSINAKTGRRNPTIVNMSWGFNSQLTLNNISEVRYKGVVYTKPGSGWTVNDRIYFGLIAAIGNDMVFYSRDASIDQDCVDAIADGIIMCGAAGNFYMYNERLGGDLYDNYLKYIFNYYYMRGPSPGAATGVIHVSAVDSTVAEQKVNFSNAGPRTDVFSPGANIMSSMNTSDTTDPRNTSFYKGNMSGTSQATPQVTGIIACALETYPNMTPAQALTYIQTYANSGVLSDSALNTNYGSIDFLNTNTLFNGPNKYITYRKERGDQYQVYPKRDYNVRPASGRTYPRPRIRRFG
jgi:hypothetical protein